MERAAPSPSRRNVLLGLAGVAAAGLVATARWIPSAEERTRRILASNPVTRRFLSLANAEQGEWAQQVGSEFRVEGGYRLKLAGIESSRSIGERPQQVTRRRGFIAVFDVLDGASMAGDLIYSASHSQYGSLPLFLSASGSPSRMFAIFN